MWKLFRNLPANKALASSGVKAPQLLGRRSQQTSLFSRCSWNARVYRAQFSTEAPQQGGETPPQQEAPKRMRDMPELIPIPDLQSYPPKIEKVIEELSALNMFELFMVMHGMAKKLGVSMETILSGGGIGGGGGGGGAASAEAAKPQEVKKEKTTFSIRLTKLDEGAKYKVLKEFRTIKPGLSLTDTKKLLENLPKVLLENVSKDEAEKAAEKLRASGAVVEIE